MNHKALNRKLKSRDLGDDFLEKNLLFDVDFFSLSRNEFERAMERANNKMEWYWTDQSKHYMLADCNRFHFMWLGHFQEWCTKNGKANPAIGRAYGKWNGQPHAWAWVVVDDKLIFVNWGSEEEPEHYSGNGSVAV
jgi:hypothetical protein